MKILITGGAGFIGSHLADRLLQRGDQVMVIDNYATGRRDNLSAHANLQIIEGTIADQELVIQSFEQFQPDLVVHAAASYKNPDNWEEDTYTNITGTVNVLRGMKQVACDRIIYFQTALCYGVKPLAQPIQLDHALFPANSSYAITKTAAEHFIEISGLNYVSFRLANAYGPRNISGPLPTFYQRLTQGKACFVMDTRRDFIYIDDMIDCVMKAVEGKGKGIYHISSGKDYSIKELFDATIAALDLQLDNDVEVKPRNPDDAFTILLDPKKTNAEFGWDISTPLVEGVKRAINYYNNFGINETFTHLKQEN
ncbi:MAG: NAD-dependent epimerase/dehydratase family protein [Gammaproteobacteria bacterium]|nr:NAD-dependent epimerase/dehydratase family protein [Gammaproteobacteria bacterium]